MIYTLRLSTDPPLTERERRNWVAFTRGLAGCIERREDERPGLLPRLSWDGGCGDVDRRSAPAVDVQIKELTAGQRASLIDGLRILSDYFWRRDDARAQALLFRLAA